MHPDVALHSTDKIESWMRLIKKIIGVIRGKDNQCQHFAIEIKLGLY